MNTVKQKINNYLVNSYKRILAYQVSDVLNLPKSFVWVDDTKPWLNALRKRRIQRWFIYKAWQQYIPNLRWLVILITALITFWSVTKYLPSFDITKIAELNHPADATLMLALIGSPIAFVIWWFRDSNARQQIENQRKDVNLKDFQRLAEWAAGMHLPENKVTSSEKQIKEKTSIKHESLMSIEASSLPEKTVIHTPSRREGAASLQIAAIYQLQAFLQGDYGRYFQRPAFQLLKSIWLALVSPNLAELEKIMQEKRDFTNERDLAKFKEKLNQWKTNLKLTMSSPVGEAIMVALGAQQGWLLRTHQSDLPNAVLSGYNSRLAALKQPLELDDLNLSGIKLQCANLRYSQFQGANLYGAELQGAYLIRAQLQGADLSDAQMQGANLFRAQLQGADLSEARMQGANLGYAQLKGADLRDVQLQGANLRFASVQGANLFRAELQGADLSYTQLHDANLTNVTFDARTNFKGCKLDFDNNILIVKEDDDFNEYIDIDASFKMRKQLKAQGMTLPDMLHLQLYSKPAEYIFKNKQGELESRNDVGLFSSFD